MKTLPTLIAGLAVAILCFMAGDGLAHYFHPYSDASLFGDNPTAQSVFRQLPGSFWGIILAGWAAGSILAGIVMRKIRSKTSWWLPFAASLLLSLTTYSNMHHFWHPAWFIVSTYLIFFPSAFLGYYLPGKPEFRKSEEITP
jgi:uncharacterized membrane protein (UPF0136 family)